MKEKTIFICYSNKDKEICDIYKEALSSIGFKVHTGVSIKIGELYEDALKIMLKKCDLVLVILTSNFIAGAWNKDITNVFMLSKQREKILILNHSNKPIPSYLSMYPNRDFSEADEKEIKIYFQKFLKPHYVFEDVNYSNNYLDVFKNNVNRYITVVCGAGASYAPQWNTVVNNMFVNHLSKLGLSDIEIKSFMEALPSSSIIRAQYLKILLEENYITELRKEIYSAKNEKNKTPIVIADYIENN